MAFREPPKLTPDMLEARELARAILAGESGRPNAVEFDLASQLDKCVTALQAYEQGTHPNLSNLEDSIHFRYQKKPITFYELDGTVRQAIYRDSFAGTTAGWFVTDGAFEDMKKRRTWGPSAEVSQ